MMTLHLHCIHFVTKGLWSEAFDDLYASLKGRAPTEPFPHSVRGFLTAVVRKKLGHMLVSEKIGEERIYRIVANDFSPKHKGRSGHKAA
jgi:hypothetical protein